MSPEERALHVRKQNNDRQIRKREKEHKALHSAPMTPDLEEFVQELLKLSIREAAWALALWEKQMKRPFPKIERPSRAPGMEWSELNRLNHNWTRWNVIRYFAVDAIARDKGRKRTARFVENEQMRAAALGMDLAAYQLKKRRDRANEAQAEKRRKVLSPRAA